ncbi:45600_t:CDS:2, partial [Gigaspora margarita]
SFFVPLQVRNNEQYLKDAGYEMGSRLESQHATLADVVYLYANNLTDWLILIILKQKEIENLCQIVQQDIIMPNFNE